MHSAREDYRAFHRRRYAILRDLLGKYTVAGSRCLDVGGGGGISEVTETLQGLYAEVHAAEFGDNVEEGLRRGILTQRVDVDREDLPYPEGHFELVLFASVIEHLYNPRHVLDEIARVLRPGGILLLEAPNAVALGRRLDALLGRNPFAVFNRFNAGEGKASLSECAIFYTAEEVEDLLREHYAVLERRYGMHDPRVNPLKRLLRETAARLNPCLADCFFVVARREP